MVRDGLGMRMQAMVECGWAWNVLGKEGLGALREGFGYGYGDDVEGQGDGDFGHGQGYGDQR